MPGTTRYSATFDRTYEEDDRTGRRSRSLSLQANGALYTPLSAPQQRSSSTDGGPDHIPTRTVSKTVVKTHNNPFQFVKVGTCHLYKKAEEQLKKTKEVKKPDVLKEEEEEWQTNLDSWKSRRRKMSEDVFRRQEEIKQLEMEEQEQQCNQRKTKTFSEMLESRAHRGRALSLCLISSPLDLQNWGVEDRGSKSCSNSNYSGGSEENSTVNSEDEGVSFKGLNEKNGQSFTQNVSNKNRTNGIINISMTNSPSSSCDGLSELDTNGLNTPRREVPFVDSGLESMSGCSHGAADTPDSGSDSSHDGGSSLDRESPMANGTNAYKNGHPEAVNGDLMKHSCSDMKIKLNLNSKEDVLGFTFQGAKHDGQVVVSSILEGSSAQASGLHVGDCIESINSTKIRFRKLSEINAILLKGKEKNFVELHVWRQDKPSSENDHPHQNGIANGYTSNNKTQKVHEEVDKNGDNGSISPFQKHNSALNSPNLPTKVSENHERSIESENEIYVDDFEELEKSQIPVGSMKVLSVITSVNNQENSLQSSTAPDFISLKLNGNETSTAKNENNNIFDKKGSGSTSPIPEVTVKCVIRKKTKVCSKNDSVALPKTSDTTLKSPEENSTESALVQDGSEQKIKLKVKGKSIAKCRIDSLSSGKENAATQQVIQNMTCKQNVEKLLHKFPIEVVGESCNSLQKNIPSNASNKTLADAKAEDRHLSPNGHPKCVQKLTCEDDKLSIKISDPLLNKIISNELLQSNSVSKSCFNEATETKNKASVLKKCTKNLIPNQRKAENKFPTSKNTSENCDDKKIPNNHSAASQNIQSSSPDIKGKSKSFLKSDSSGTKPATRLTDLKPCSSGTSRDVANETAATSAHDAAVCKGKTKNKSLKKTSIQKQIAANLEESITTGKESLNIIFESHPINYTTTELVNRTNEDCGSSSEENPPFSNQEVVPVEKVAEEMEKLILEQLEEEERAKELAAEARQVKCVERTPDHLLTAPPRLAEPPKEKPPPPPTSSNEIQKPNPLKRVNSTKRIKKEIHKRRSNFLGIENADENIVCDEPSMPPPLALEEILKAEMELDRESRKKVESATVERLTLEEKEIMLKEREIIESLESEERRRLLFGIHTEMPSPVSTEVMPIGLDEDRIHILREERKRLEEDHIFTEEKQLLLERAEYIKRQEDTSSGADFSAPLLSVATHLPPSPAPSLSSDSIPLEPNSGASGGGGENTLLSDNAPISASGGKSDEVTSPIKPPKPIPPPKPLKKKEALRKERERLRQEQEALQREREEHRRKLAEQEELLRNQKSHGTLARNLFNIALVLTVIIPLSLGYLASCVSKVHD